MAPFPNSVKAQKKLKNPFFSKKKKKHKPDLIRAKMADHGNVVVVSSTQHFKEKVEEAKSTNKLVVIDFTATWCGPCRIMAPIFEALSKQFPGVVFLKVDVDEQKEVAQEYKVTAMPTFAFVKDGVKFDELVGADKGKLEQMVVQYATAAAA
ncbi:hypothetical protein LUZ61_016296 [Rhynchospora tenuis]|uniref:Phloem sap 13 kDa protein 1 n=1 Tax=Rhynchospora tenuis TaxID=198213 RepID=A0AAD5Z583_9POAL|nr:hypothetical protein LUZ61_016296 [Rhynchospora tenuis]